MDRNEMFEKYLYLADEMAKKYGERYGVDIDDAIQEARICLWNAIEKNQAKEYPIEVFFERYAPRIYLKSLFELYSPVHCPAQMVHNVRKGMNAIEANKPGNMVKNFAGSRCIRRKDAREALLLAGLIKSLTNYEVLEDDILTHTGVDVETQYIEDFRTEEILNVMKKYCSDREVDIIAATFGFLNSKENYRDMASKYGVSPQRFGQIYR